MAALFFQASARRLLKWAATKTLAHVAISVGLLFSSANAFGGNLSELEIFERCFKRMVRDIPQSNDPLWVKVQNGQLKGAAACLQLLDKAKFAANGRISSANDVQARAILRSFNDFHGSWFQSRVTDIGNRQGAMTSALLADLEEPALFVTRALFGGKAYRSVVTEKTSLQGIRVREATKNNAPAFMAQRLIRYPTNIPGFDGSATDLRLALQIPGSPTTFISVPDNRIVNVGELIGVKEVTTYSFPFLRGFSIRDATRAGFEAAQKDAPVNENFGAGIVGSPVFFMNNASLNSNIHPTAPTSESYYVNRPMAARAFEDLLCHHLPTLTEADVKSMVDRKALHAFNQNSTCMQCHAQIDPFAAVYRNLVLVNSSTALNMNGSNQHGFPIQMVTRFPVSKEPTASYAETAPTGTLRYRAFRSKAPTTMSINGIAQLGQGLAASKDLYECAAKRYYQFFTGIEVPLDTIPAPGAGSDAETKAKYALDVKHQKFVLTLASNLQKNQSLRSLVNSIFTSPQFKARDYQSAQEVP